jgi:hypothetical protein
MAHRASLSALLSARDRPPCPARRAGDVSPSCRCLSAQDVCPSSVVCGAVDGGSRQRPGGRAREGGEDKRCCNVWLAHLGARRAHSCAVVSAVPTRAQSSRSRASLSQAQRTRHGRRCCTTHAATGAGTSKDQGVHPGSRVSRQTGEARALSKQTRPDHCAAAHGCSLARHRAMSDRTCDDNVIHDGCGNLSCLSRLRVPRLTVNAAAVAPLCYRCCCCLVFQLRHPSGA